MSVLGLRTLRLSVRGLCLLISRVLVYFLVKYTY